MTRSLMGFFGQRQETGSFLGIGSFPVPGANAMLMTNSAAIPVLNCRNFVAVETFNLKVSSVLIYVATC